MRYVNIAVFSIVVWTCSMLYAGEEKTEGLEVVPDTAVAVLRKVNAFFTGNLEWTMPSGKDIYKDDYTFDPQGRRIPRATLGKYDSGVR